MALKQISINAILQGAMFIQQVLGKLSDTSLSPFNQVMYFLLDKRWDKSSFSKKEWGSINGGGGGLLTSC